MLEFIYELEQDQPLDSFLNQNIKNAILQAEDQKIDLNTLGTVMASNPSLNLSAKGGNGWNGDVWQKIKGELYSFFCKNDPKYKALQDEVKKANKNTSSVVVPIISAFLAKELNMLAGVILPFVILFFKISLKIAKEGFCAYWQNQV